MVARTIWILSRMRYSAETDVVWERVYSKMHNAVVNKYWYICVHLIGDHVT
jgi:hypothetical protein